MQFTEGEVNGMTDDEYMKLVVQLARIEERQVSQQEAAEHRHNNLKMSLDAFATKKDVEVTNERIISLKAEHASRIASLESNQARVVWALLGTMGGVVVNLLGLTKKFGF